MNGKAWKSDTDQGWFFEAGYTAPRGASGGFDLGFNETNSRFPGIGVGLPYGMSGVNEAGVVQHESPSLGNEPIH
jgi:hypothetical protein